MPKINTEYLGKCIAPVEKSYEMLRQTNEGTIEYELYRIHYLKVLKLPWNKVVNC